MDVQFDKVKTLNALLYVANRMQRNDFHKIFKIIYFADRQHLADWGRPITGDTYIAMEAGPVPSRLYDMLKIVRGDSYITDAEGLSNYFRVENWMYVKPLQDADLSKLSANEREALSEAISKYADLSYDEIKEKSHDVAWRSTARDFSISWDNIACEAGLDSEDLEYVNQFSKFVAANTTSPNARTAEEMHAILAERIRRAEAGEEDIVPNQVVFDSIRSKYGF